MEYGVNELRRSYLNFFEGKDHLAMKSFSLVPKNDNSLLLINAGMAPLKPYFTGQEVPPRKRVTTCQKCVRTGDIENVGKTARHLTFFEMLGNFSFGDYFKKEAIHWSWEYLTDVLKLSPDRLYPSIYGEDDEAFEIWNKEIGIPAEKIKRFYRDPETGECDNFWEHGAGPCGPCSEIYYDRGEKYGCGKPTCGVGCDCDRYMEVWNNVFTQFNGDGHGGYEELENKNIDTGMGLERLAVVMQDVDSVFDIDTMKAIRDEVCALSGKTYQTNAAADVSIRLITDHIRSTTFLISDGVLPSNEGRGYVLRRLIRRAARHGRMLGIEGEFMAKLSAVVVRESSDGYPELEEKKEYIFKVLTEEEKQFNKTIDKGLEILSSMEDDLKKSGKTVLSGEDAFKLYDTYGFPKDLTSEILAEKGLSFDEKGFEKCMEIQRSTARGARKETNYMGKDATVYEKLDPAQTSEFTGYDTLETDSKIIALTSETDVKDELTEGETGTLIAEKSPFYGTMGGQTGDTGVITNGEARFVVEDTIHLSGGKIGHVGHVAAGSFKVGDSVRLSVDSDRRNTIAKNHSATHLLQRALRDVLGDHVHQKGSDVNADRLRFDFTHFSAMTAEELQKVETLVNERVRAAVPVVTEVMSLDEAMKTGAMALFDEKYGEKVRVVKMGEYSTELCGGTHVKNTGDVAAFKILSESGISSGVRRIEAITSEAVFDYYSTVEDMLSKAAELLKTTPAGVNDRIEHMLKEIKDLSSENESLKSKAAKTSLGDVMDKVKDVKGVKLLAANVPGVDMNGLRDLGDSLKEKLGDGVIVLSSDKDGKVSLVVMATDGAQSKGAHAGNLIKAIAAKVGGGGGGKPNMAQAGGKNPAGIEDALREAENVLSGQIS
ncbi:MAG: alanine--tRNA ligase [Lachnospiraceae bacterium]|nr:alanine--tRNA ligase [Lachnospiraceae bacterium]